MIEDIEGYGFCLLFFLAPLLIIPISLAIFGVLYLITLIVGDVGWYLVWVPIILAFVAIGKAAPFSDHTGSGSQDITGQADQY